MKKAKVLFLCTGNSCRSQMAEGFLSQYDRIETCSAGTEPAAEVNPLAVKVMMETGVDISSQQPQMVDVYLQQEFDYVITVCNTARESCPVFLGKVKNRLHFSFEDPAGKSLKVFWQVRNEIKSMTAELAENIREAL